MKFIRVPAEYQSAIRKHALKSWLKKSVFSKSVTFDFIDSTFERMQAILPESVEPENSSIVACIAVVVNEDGSLAEYIVGNQQDIGDDDAWHEICTAAGWIILQKYISNKKKILKEYLQSKNQKVGE